MPAVPRLQIEVETRGRGQQVHGHPQLCGDSRPDRAREGECKIRLVMKSLLILFVLLKSDFRLTA